jgi:hypothetical protein
LVELRNSLQEIERENVLAAGLARRLIEALTEIQVELATFEGDTLAKRAHVNKLMTDLRTLEEDVKRLSALAPSEETPGDRVRSFVGDGDRQYLTGLEVGGRRISAADASASMLAETVVNAAPAESARGRQKTCREVAASRVDGGLAHDADSTGKPLSDVHIQHDGPSRRSGD